MAILRPSGPVVPALLMLLSGCNGCRDDELLPTLLEAEDATPVGVWVGEGLGASPVSVPVYATSALGAVVPASAIAVTSDATVDSTVTPGADGWGVASVSAPDRGRFTLSATLDAATADGAASVVETAPGVLDAYASATGAEPTQIARAAGGTLRQPDLFGRFGGEEFIAFLPHTDTLGAIDAAERIREAVTRLALEWRGQSMRATVSVGVISLDRGHVSLGALIADADLALYTAKDAGRNCVRTGLNPQLVGRVQGAELPLGGAHNNTP
jgi:hypothetical protein